MRSYSLFLALVGCTYPVMPAPQAEDNSVPIFGAPSGGGDDPAASNSTDNDGDGFTVDDGDCNDGRADIHPGATESADCDSIDADCDGSDRNDLYRSANDCGAEDDDGDGVFEENERGDTVDCDDQDASVFPGAGFNEEDEDDAAACCQDRDGDGYCDDNVTSAQEDDGVMEGTDCSDTDEDIHPGAADDDADGIDDDCDGEVDREGSVGGGDFDDDDCDGWSEEQGDCDDDDDHVFPFACYNEEDDDVFLGCGRDDDEDGWCDDSVSNSEEDDGMVEGEDCDDNDDNTFPNDDGECVDNGSGSGSGGNGTVEMRITNDGTYYVSSTNHSWETWIWNVTDNNGYWPGMSNPVYCGTGTSNVISCNLVVSSGDIVRLNGAWDTGNRWLLENYSGTQNHYQEIRFAGTVYTISLAENSNPGTGACTKEPGVYNFLCKIR